MQSVQEDEKSRFKLAQLWHFVKSVEKRERKTHLHNRIVNEILKDDFNINYKVSIDVKLLRGPTSQLKDYTALHFVYYDVHDIHTFNALLERGADYTIKNGNGQTVLHMIMVDNDIEKQTPFINAVLSAHVKSQNFTNPRDYYGISHLHAACLVNHVEAVKLFLENGASIDDAVNLEASKFAGYTPLLFAAEYNSFEVIKTLIERGANVNVRTARRRCPLDILFENKLDPCDSQDMALVREQTLQLLLDKSPVSVVGLSSLHVACTFEDLTVAKQLLDEGVDVDYAVPMQSLVHPGDTALHFAAGNSVQAVKMLLGRGAKVDVENARGQMPIDLCTNKYNLPDLCQILSCIEDREGISLKVGQIKLLHVVAAVESLDNFKLFIRNEILNTSAVVPIDSILWPGNSLLHVALNFSKTFGRDRQTQKIGKTIIKECLARGLSVNVQNVRGQTPIHLAFCQEQRDLVKLLLKQLDALDRVKNFVDENNLSYLHIACFMKSESLVEKLLSISNPSDICRGTTLSTGSIVAGSTPLHVATANQDPRMVKLLLRHGANLHAIDSNGFTPIHWLLRVTWDRELRQVADALFTSLLVHPEEHVVDGLGLSYLHIASLLNNVEAVRTLLDLGSDVNAVVRCDERSDNHISRIALKHLQRFLNCTPLQMTVQTFRPLEEVIELLLYRGANMFVRGSEDYLKGTPSANGQVVRCFFQLLLSKDDMQKSIEEKFSLTKLHIACYLKDKNEIKRALKDGIDVNAQVLADSLIFARCTPLHLLLTITDMHDYMSVDLLRTSLDGMVNLLLDRNADVTINNAEEDTPIHVLYKHHAGFADADQCLNSLLNAHSDFKVNPMNGEGVSHFHLACRWPQVDIVEKFLKHGSVDVNRPIDYFAKNDPGCTPLHLVLNDTMSMYDRNWTELSRTVDLLLKHGADVAAKDVCGDTPLHKPAVLKSPELSILDKLVSYGGDVKSVNIQGQTPIELLPELDMDTNPLDKLKIFKKYGYNINSWNGLTGEGYIAKIFLSSYRKLSKCSEFEKFMKLSDVRTVDDLGRTAIHNSVSLSTNIYIEGRVTNYTHAIESFSRVGINIDQQDKSGQTALHYATRMENVNGAKALLACGADINILDNTGKSSFSFAIEHLEHKIDSSYIPEKNVTIVLRLHIKKLQHLRIEVSQINQNLMKRVQRFFDNPDDILSRRYDALSKKFFSQIEVTKTMDIGTNSLTLFDFLSETKAVSLYPLLPKHKRDLIDDYFTTVDYKNLKELSGIITLQLRKMAARLELIDPVLNSLRTLLGFSVPNLCEQVTRFLFNSDLKNLIESTRLQARKRKFSEISS